MKSKVALLSACVLGLVPLGCSSSSESVPSTTQTVLGSSEAPQKVSVPESPPEAVAGVSVQQLADVVCAVPPTRMDDAAEVYTQESWTCSYNDEQVRIDLYTTEDQMAEAARVTLDVYASSGDNRTLAELPVICGSKWTIGVDFNDTRDALIPELVNAGIPASIC